MIEINRHTLENGFRLLHHYDASTQMVAINTLYNVGAKDESSNHTGFAHLFEHLMFGGSANVPDFDTPLQQAGGENNAWTSNDVTNYYTVVPKQNVETALWLESDRMLQLDFSEQSLAVQKQVVIEEFKQRNLNQPYGDRFMLLRPLAYQVHPYSWAVIGKEIAHIENTTLQQVEEFFYSHYAPNNAILAIAGNISFEQAIALTEKWFASIPSRQIKTRSYPAEPKQCEARFLEVERQVPSDMIIKAYHMCSVDDPLYPAYDLLSDILSHGNSSRLYRQLVMEQQLFSEIDAYITADIEAGLIIITGKTMPNVSLEEADRAICQILQQLCEEEVDERELNKVLNKFESTQLFNNMNYLNIATNMAYHELAGSANEINTKVKQYRKISASLIRETAKEAFRPTNCSTLYYKAIK